MRLYLEHFDTECTLEYAKAMMYDICMDINLDFIGENGEEYVSVKALQNGYTSDLDYHHDRLVENFNLTNETKVTDLQSYFETMLGYITKGAYRSDYEVKIETFIREYFVAISVVCEW